MPYIGGCEPALLEKGGWDGDATQKLRSIKATQHLTVGVTGGNL